MRLLYEQLTDIPIGFTEVEYLETTNQQNNQTSATDVSWIDTGIIPNDNTKLECRMAFTTLISGNSNEALCGSTGNGVNPRFAWGFASLSPYTNFYAGLGGQNITTTVTRDTNVHTFKIDAVNKTWAIDSATGSFTSSGSLSGTSSIFLFGRHIPFYGDNVANKPANAKIYYCKIWNNGTLVRELIPCLDTSNVPCLWDKVEGKAYYNQGTGTFSYGRKIIPVEYLESSGTQYIDTGYTSNNIYSNGAFEIVCETSDTSNRVVGCGGLNNNDKNINLSFSGGGYILGLYGDKWNTNVFGYSINTKYKIKYEVTTSQQKLYVNDALIETTNYSWNSTANYPLRIFKTNADTYTKPTKIYRFKLWISNDLVRDFIPCKDENGIGFMFDKVTHSCYLNAGSGSFVVGNELPKQKLRFLKDNKLRVPNGFTEVEYLQSTGTQYIDTGLSLNKGFRTVGKLSVTSLSQTSGIIGCWESSNPFNRNFFGISSDTRFFVGYGGTGYQYFNSSTINTPYTFNIRNVHDKEYLEINGTQYNFSPTGTVGTFSSLNLYLFAMHQGNTISNPGYLKLYFIKIYNENDVLVRDYIPCLDSNNVPCLWDRVEGKAYYNAGTGAFSYGHKIIPVEYIQSTGTQYIDTGIKLTNNYSIELDYQLTQASQSRAGLFGALNMTGSNQGRFGSILSPSNQQLEHGYGAGNDYWQQGLPNTSRHKIYQKKNEVYFDGTLVHSFNTATFSLAVNAYLGNFVYTNYTPAKAKYYSSKWWNSGTLVRDYMPVKDENGVGYWFDTISHSLYPNAGTGSFVVGNEIKNVTRFLEGA